VPPEALGKVERFWATLWRDCVETAVLRGLDDARRRIGLFLDRYDLQRPHSGIAAVDLRFPEPLSSLDSLQDHPATDDSDEVSAGGSGLDDLLSDLLDEEETP
jgi:hypothetical protein